MAAGFEPNRQPVIAAEHHDRDIGMLAGQPLLDRADPVELLSLAECCAGNGLVDDMGAAVAQEHALQRAGDTLGLGIAEDHDGPHRPRWRGRAGFGSGR